MRCVPGRHAALAVLLLAAPLPAQQSDASLAWGAGTVALGGLAGLDGAIEQHALSRRSPTADRLADVGDVLGRGSTLAPALAIGWLGARITREQRMERAMVHAIAAYTAANLVTGALKAGVGRHRPDTTGSPWRFKPGSRRSEWHSFPSGHSTHAWVLAAVAADETGDMRVAVPAYALASLVSWSRVYDDEHWASDVAAGAVVGIVASQVTGRWLRARWGRDGVSAEAPVSLLLAPRLVGVRVMWDP